MPLNPDGDEYVSLLLSVTVECRVSWEAYIWAGIHPRHLFSGKDITQALIADRSLPNCGGGYDYDITYVPQVLFFCCLAVTFGVRPLITLESLSYVLFMKYISLTICIP